MRIGRALAALVIGGLVGVVAAIAWAIIVKTTGYEIGFAAVGVGFVTGYAVLLATLFLEPPWFFARIGLLIVMPAISVVLASGAVLLGKYLTFALTVQDEFSDAPSIASSEMRDLFSEAGDIVWGGYDVLWFILAAVAAVRGSFSGLGNRDD